ncbi:MAG: hypothetical protein M0Q51_10120 [Bacteroidales bacterium]|nr:hypothetical protein [Bacteroidales bacterium]
MKKYIFILLLIATIFLEFGCIKENHEQSNNDKSSNNLMLKIDTAYVHTTLLNNKSIIQDHLNLIAKSLVGMMNDSVFKNLVVNESLKRNVLKEYAVTISTLNDIYNANNENLDSILRESLLKMGGTHSMCDSLENIINSFVIDNITFIPKIFMPTLGTVYFDHGSWNGIDVRFVAISQFYIPSDIPTYAIADSLNVTFQGCDKVFDRPTWYISVSLDLENEQFNRNIVALICQPGEEYTCVCRPSQIGNPDWCDWDDYPGGSGNCGLPKPDGDCQMECPIAYYPMLITY